MLVCQKETVNSCGFVSHSNCGPHFHNRAHPPSYAYCQVSDSWLSYSYFLGLFIGQSHQKSRLYLPAITHLSIANTCTVSSTNESYITTWRLLCETVTHHITIQHKVFTVLICLQQNTKVKKLMNLKKKKGNQLSVTVTDIMQKHAASIYRV
jgi:hypothetical protein